MSLAGEKAGKKSILRKRKDLDYGYEMTTLQIDTETHPHQPYTQTASIRHLPGRIKHATIINNSK